MQNVKKIACGEFNTALLLYDGQIYVCGNRLKGNMGLRDDVENEFCKVVGLPSNIVDIGCGRLHTVILLADGKLLAIGMNMYGQLGTYFRHMSTEFEIIKDHPKDIIKVVVHRNTTLIQLQNGTIMICGQLFNDRILPGYSRSYARFKEIKNWTTYIDSLNCAENMVLVMLGNGKNLIELVDFCE